MVLEHLNRLYKRVKVNEIFGRYITNSDLEKFLDFFPKLDVSTLGESVEQKPIYGVKVGYGNTKVLIWSQMHGNESTSTKALLDCLNMFMTTENELNQILKTCTLFIIPILNPDGAAYYTRFNANNIDLNRDAQDLSQPESRLLFQVFNNFKPNFCFNLHGQRTIYNVARTDKSAILAFLSPSENEERSITATRRKAMAIIAEVNKFLQVEMPNNVARYDDSFNLNCVGDTFQSLGTPTLLYEAGHYPNDFQREEVRRLMFLAIVKGLEVISAGKTDLDYHDYLKIPENDKKFYDIIIRSARINNTSSEVSDIAIQYKEVLINESIAFIPEVVAISKLDNFYGHREIDAQGWIVKTSENLELNIAYENDFVLINNEKISLKPLDI